MSTQYDTIGASYDALKQLPIVAVERANVRSALGDLTDKAVLDLACGTGRYSQLLVSLGARRVVGIDISREMIRVASSASAAAVESGQIEYGVGDCAQPLGRIGEFDVVLGVWLLNYAANRKEMLAMWQNIYDNLKSGGVFVGVTPSPDAGDKDDQFGMTVERIEKVDGGYRVRVTGNSDPPIVFENYQLDSEIYKECARAVGMQDPDFQAPFVPDDFEAPVAGYLDGWKSKPHFAIFVAKKV